MPFFDFPKRPPWPKASQPDPYTGENVTVIHSESFVAQQAAFEQERLKKRLREQQRLDALIQKGSLLQEKCFQPIENRKPGPQLFFTVLRRVQG